MDNFVKHLLPPLILTMWVIGPTGAPAAQADVIWTLPSLIQGL